MLAGGYAVLCHVRLHSGVCGVRGVCVWGGVGGWCWGGGGACVLGVCVCTCSLWLSWVFN